MDNQEINPLFDVINSLTGKVREEEENKFISIKDSPSFVLEFIQSGGVKSFPFKKFMYLGDRETVYHYSPSLEKLLDHFNWHYIKCDSIQDLKEYLTKNNEKR